MQTTLNRKPRTKLGASKYDADLEECKKQIEMSIDYFNGTKKVPKRNALKSSSTSTKLKPVAVRSRNFAKDKIMYKKYNSNNATGKNIELSGKRLSSAFMTNSNTSTSKNSRAYKRFSNQRDSGFSQSKTSDKENDQKLSNNALRLSRNSLGGAFNLQGNLSSTGAYNSVTKHSRDDERPATVTTYAPKLSNNQSTRTKPIYQMCETGASVERFSKCSQGNKDTSFSCNELSNSISEINDEFLQKTFERNTQPNRNFGSKNTKSKAFLYKEQTEVVEAETVNNCDSIKSSISDSTVSEGSLIVQNLPTSKVVYASKKNSGPGVNSQNNLRPQRQDYVIRTNSCLNQTRNKKVLEESKYEFGSQEAIYEVGSSSDSSDGFDDSMEVVVELENNIEDKRPNHLNSQYLNQFKGKIVKPESAKNKLASTQKFTYPLKQDLKYQRKSTGNHLDAYKQKAREQKTLQYNLRLAVEKGDVFTLQKILRSNKNSKQNCVDLNSQGQDQWTLLHIATNEGNYSIVKLLLEYGANPNPQSVNQRTALHIACMRGHPSIVKALLDSGADINISDMDGNTPVHLWSEFGHHDLLRYLLTKRPTLYVLNKYGKSPVDVAANNEILQIFDEHLNFIKHELFHNIAEMNGLNFDNAGAPLSHRTKLVKVQDSLLDPSEEFSPNSGELTGRETKRARNHAIQQNLLLHEQKFHPEMTKKYGFKEGKYLLTNEDSKQSQEDTKALEEVAEIIGPKSFVPIMVLGKGSFGEVYLVQK